MTGVSKLYCYQSTTINLVRPNGSLKNDFRLWCDIHHKFNHNTQRQSCLFFFFVFGLQHATQTMTIVKSTRVLQDYGFQRTTKCRYEKGFDPKILLQTWPDCNVHVGKNQKQSFILTRVCIGSWDTFISRNKQKYACNLFTCNTKIPKTHQAPDSAILMHYRQPQTNQPTW
jgi:hypothetical protein